MLVPRFFIRSAGALLLTAAFVLFLTNLATGELAQPRDPLLHVSIRLWFWFCGMTFLLVALFCLFGRWEFRQLAMLVWVSTILVVYFTALLWLETNKPGFLFASIGDTFGVSVNLATGVAACVLAYIFLGGVTMLLWLLWGVRVRKWAVHPDQFFKLFCPGCGGHIQYAVHNVGERVSCPHCAAAVTLRSPGNLKMSCYFCKEHIEFPSHAIGTKMPCPHCKREITLKEFTSA
jgi:hypothetical protein